MYREAKTFRLEILYFLMPPISIPAMSPISIPAMPSLAGAGELSLAGAVVGAPRPLASTLVKHLVMIRIGVIPRK